MKKVCAICGERIKKDDLWSSLTEVADEDIWVCGKCYPDRIADHFPAQLQAAIHCNVGLDLALSEVNDEQAEECFLRGLAVYRTADLLSGLAGVVKSQKEKDRLNREALKLDPFHLGARLNLARATPEDMKHVVAEIEAEGGHIPQGCCFCGNRKKPLREYRGEPFCPVCWPHRRRVLG